MQMIIVWSESPAKVAYVYYVLVNNAFPCNCLCLVGERMSTGAM